MPINPYFNHSNPSNVDAKLYEDLIIESIQIKGFDVYYIPRDIIEQHKIFNEEILSQFTSAYAIEVYLTEQDGFGGQGELIAKFGLQIKESATFQFSKRRWEELIQSNLNDIEQKVPHEGDLLYDPISKKLFEIRFVEDEVPFYQLANLPVYEAQCELFEYEGQALNTGIDEIDDLENIFAPQVQVSVDLLQGDFIQKEPLVIILQDGTEVNCTLGDIYEIEEGEIIMDLLGVTYPGGKFKRITSGATVTGELSASTAIIIKEVEKQSNEKYGKNSIFRKESIDIIDWSENNPFGEL